MFLRSADTEEKKNPRLEVSHSKLYLVMEMSSVKLLLVTNYRMFGYMQSDRDFQ